MTDLNLLIFAYSLIQQRVPNCALTGSFKSTVKNTKKVSHFKQASNCEWDDANKAFLTNFPHKRYKAKLRICFKNIWPFRVNSIRNVARQVH